MMRIAHRIADRFIEEKNVEKADGCPAIKGGHADTRDNAHNGMKCEKQRRVDPVEDYHPNEATNRKNNLAK